MIRVFNKLLLLFLFGIFALLPNQATAQRIFGVNWNVPDNANNAIQQLDRFRKMGITYIEIDRIVSDELWNAMQSRGFNVFVQIPVRYPVVETFSSPDSGLIATYQLFLSGYSEREIDALGVFEYGQTGSRSFPDVLAPFIHQIKNIFPVPVYLKDWRYQPQPADSLFSFKIVRTAVDKNFPAFADSNFTRARAFLYRPSSSLRLSVNVLNWFLEKTSVNKDAILFFNSTWLLNFLKEHPEVENVLTEYASRPDALFPLPEETLPDESRHSWIVLMLLILWGSFAINYSFEPMYRKSLFRYFLSHKFFVEDVMGRHIRSTLPSLVILVQHALMGGIFLYSFAGIYFSPMGSGAFFHHFHRLDLFGTKPIAFFLIGILITLSFELFCLLWLYLVNRKLNYMSQITILYSWSLQLNLPVITLIVTLLMAGSSTFLMIPVFLFYLAILIAAFPIAAFDSGQYLSNYKPLYFTGTIGIYFIGIAGLIFWIFNNSYLINVLRLAIALR